MIAYSISQRTRESGIRVARSAGNWRGYSCATGLQLTAAGVVCGLGASVALTRLMSSLLFEVRRFDPVTCGAVPIGLVAAAALASGGIDRSLTVKHFLSHDQRE